MSIRSAVNVRLKRLEKPFETYNLITVSRSALLHNFDLLQALQPRGFVIPVLKSNAYGHGIGEVATILKERSFPYIAVDGFYESLAIRSVSKQPVLVMGAIQPENYARMDFKRLAVVVNDEAAVRALGRLNKKIKLHIELETGMARHGVAAKALPEFLRLLSAYPSLQLEGVMTHLADADNPEDDSYTAQQVERFDSMVGQVLAAGFKPAYLHIAQSAGSAKVKSKYANTLRVGIALYGITPLESGDAHYSRLSQLRPALQLTSTIAKVVELQAGDTVSYGRTYTAKKPTRLGVLPIGYYEGLPRALSNSGVVQHSGDYLPIVGRVCMNHTMVELGDSHATVGDQVLVFSANPASQVAINNICQQHSLFNYGVLVGLNQNVRRAVVG